MIHSLWVDKGILWGGRAWKKVTRAWKPSQLLSPTLACFHLFTFISQTCYQQLCALPAMQCCPAGSAVPCVPSLPLWVTLPIAVLWAVLDPKLPNLLRFPSPLHPGYCFSACSWPTVIPHKKFQAFASSASLALSSFSHSLLQGLSCLHLRAVLRKQMQA